MSKRERKPAAKNDPRLVAAARELRDRWLEQVNAGGLAQTVTTKHDVARELPAVGRGRIQLRPPASSQPAPSLLAG